MFRVPLPNLLVHIHGAVFTLWILLLITQTSLVADHRVDIHRPLGLVGFALAPLMVILGVLVASDSIIRHSTTSEMAAATRTFYATPLAGMVMFSVLIYFAFRNRFNPAAHKRLILIANLAIVDAALDRWPVPVEWWTNRIANLVVVYPILLLLMANDWWSTRKILPATLWGRAFLVATVANPLREIERELPAARMYHSGGRSGCPNLIWPCT